MHTLMTLILGGSVAVASFLGHAFQPVASFVETHITAPIEQSMGVDDENAPVPAATTTTPAERQQLPQNTTALGPYDVLIADRGNNRVIEVTPQKQIVWQYDFNLPRKGQGADDAFFTDGGNTVMMSLENFDIIEQIDYATKTREWRYGVPGVPGHAAGYLNTPDDAYKLGNGDVIVADIKNCRIIEVSPAGDIVRQYGKTDRCGKAPGELNSPNGDTPLPNGHILISEIGSHDIVELDQNWQKIATYPLPIPYPSDPQLMQNGDIIVANYRDPGAIIEINPKTDQVVWQYSYASGEGRLRYPSLAFEMPNGIILANDDLNHRVIAIDKNTNQIVWQYGVTGKPGADSGQLNIPDGLSIIDRSKSIASSSPQSLNLPVYTVGTLMNRGAYFANTMVQIHGYILKNEQGYSLASDESSGAVSARDLPVVGTALETLVPGKPYLFRGTLVKGGLAASNGNPYHLELENDPTPYP
ncbi:MAG: hypothetical protein KGI73_02580 [Patescibacteria group bacterium]|nr:hypothetical protein [Patescibacteria group bacterium]